MDDIIKNDSKLLQPENSTEKKEALSLSEKLSADITNSVDNANRIITENPAELPPKAECEMPLPALPADQDEELPPPPPEFFAGTDQESTIEKSASDIQPEIIIPSLPDTKKISSSETETLSDRLIDSLSVDHNAVISNTVSSKNDLGYSNEMIIDDFKHWLSQNKHNNTEQTEKERKNLSSQLINWAKEIILGKLTSYYDRLFDTYQKEVKRQETVILEEIKKKNSGFKNGTKGKEYQAQIDFPEKIKIVEVTESKSSGLAFQILPYEHSVIFNGILEKHDKKQAETIKVDFYLTYEGRIPDYPLKYTLTLTVNPDSWDLWNDIATGESVPYYKPDTATQYLEVNTSENTSGKNIIAASRRGRSHANVGSPRDDDFQIEYCRETGWYLLAVADGAGSAKYSRQGSKIACRKIIDTCKDSFGNTPFEKFENLFTPDVLEKTNAINSSLFVGCYHTIVKAAYTAQQAIEEEVKNFNKNSNSEKVMIKDFATTLLFTACKKFPFGWIVISFSVGDGAIAVISDYNKKEHPLLAEPDEGTFSGQTRFLTMPDIFSSYENAVSRLHIDCYTDFEALILMTDGISDPKFESTAKLHETELWKQFWNELSEQTNLKGNPEEAKEKLLEWLNFRSPGNHDDRTIAVLY